MSGEPIRRAVGAYRQADLERMTDRDLAALRDWAAERFNADTDAPDADYYELLSGAADELLLARRND